MAPGCQWTDCKPTNGGVETCDGIDNDCNGKVDDAMTPKGPICDDGDMCNGVEICKAGKCAAGAGLKCEGKTCFDAKCDAKKGCQYTPNTAGCNDGDPCSTKDTCNGGKCKGTAQKDCNDGDKCTKDVCKVINGQAKCQNLAGQGCDDSNPCTVDSCDAKTGCSHKAKTGACSDGNHCTGSGKDVDTCKDGKCVGGAAVKCDDGNACTKDACDPKKGCTKTPTTGACNDNNPCTLGEKCTNGACGGSKPKCNDNNICTSDSCDAKTGACKFAPLPGCKICTTASQCNDNNGCTKDACTKVGAQSKCTHTQISGCIGPLDYKVVDIKPKTLPIDVPGALLFRLTVRNDGKPYGGNFQGKMTYKLYFSADAVVDSKDKYIYGTKWSGYNIGAPKKPESYIDKGVNITTAQIVGAKYLCVLLEHGQDKNKANNSKCVPVTFRKPDFAVTKAVVAGYPVQSVTAGQIAYLTFAYKNLGKAVTKLYMQFYVSKDNKIDTKDLKATPYGINFGAINTGQTIEKKNWKVSVPPTAQADHKFLCVRVNVWQDAWKNESNTTNNDMCAPIKIVNYPNFAPPPQNYIGFKNKAGKVYGNVPWGGEYACYLSAISNAGNGDFDGELPIRCWYSTDGKLTTTQKDGWAVQWKQKAKIPGKGVLKTVTGTTFDKFDAPKMGVGYICAELNYDKSVKESTTHHNKGCRKITVLGIDLFMRPNSTFGAASWKHPQPGTLKRGVDLSAIFQWCNQGNQVLYAKTKGLKTRILLSKDKTASADDVVLMETNDFGYSKIGGMNQFGKPSCANSVLSGKKAKIPTTVTPGNYFLIFDINHDEKYVEPMANNAMVKAVVIQ